jgi:outer membrane immunogenic protein
MKHILLLVALSNISIFIFSQSLLEKGQVQCSGGFQFSEDGSPIYVGGDYAIYKSITVGGRLSYKENSQTVLRNRYSQSLLIISVSGNYHFNDLLNLPKKWNIYGGLGLGYYAWSDVKWNNGIGTDDVGESSRPVFDVQFGGRYHFTKYWAVNLELGGGTRSGLSIGITFKPD